MISDYIKGTDIVESDLMLKKRIIGNKYKLVLPVKLFDDKFVYTWSLKLCYKSLGKSAQSSTTFQVVKK